MEKYLLKVFSYLKIVFKEFKIKFVNVWDLVIFFIKFLS